MKKVCVNCLGSGSAGARHKVGDTYQTGLCPGCDGAGYLYTEGSWRRDFLTGLLSGFVIAVVACALVALWATVGGEAP